MKSLARPSRGTELRALYVSVMLQVLADWSILTKTIDLDIQLEPLSLTKQTFDEETNDKSTSIVDKACTRNMPDPAERVKDRECLRLLQLS